jgi:hypothetical protein
MLSVGAVALLGASGLSAQTKAAATIPFEFTAHQAQDYVDGMRSAALDLIEPSDSRC